MTSSLFSTQYWYVRDGLIYTDYWADLPEEFEAYKRGVIRFNRKQAERDLLRQVRMIEFLSIFKADS